MCKRNIMSKIVIAALAVIGLTIGLVVGTNSVYANNNGGAVILPGYGGNWSGGCSGADCGCDATANTYRIDCAGTSWVYYKAASSTQARDITMVRHQGDSGTLIVPKSCAEHENGGFWHYGVNVINGSVSDNGAPYVFGQYGHWSTRSFASFAALGAGGTYNMINSALLNQVVGGGLYQAFGGTLTDSSGRSYNMSGTRENVLRDYMTAWNTLYPNDKVNNMNEAQSKLVGQAMFCWWPGMGNDYYSNSNVSIASLSGNGMSGYASTGIVTEGEAETRIVVAPDEEFQIVFSHNPYSIEDEGTPKTQIRRIYYKLDGERQNAYASFDNTSWFTVTIPGAGEANGTYADSISDQYVSGQVETWEDTGATYYIGNPREYTDGASNFAYRDAINIKFNDVDPIGRWRFCEIHTVYDEDENGERTNEATTTVCAEVEVGGGSTYYSVSNVSNSLIGGWETTGITNVRGTRKYTGLATANVGETATLTFSHNVYSDMPITDADVPWLATRENLTSTTNYTVTPDFTVSLSGANKMPLAESGYYTIEQAYRHNDGYNQYFIVRERFNVTFNVAGTYTFCETINVDDLSQGYMTAACTRVVVSNGTTPLSCSMWTPYSYNDSGVPHGVVVNGTTSILSKIRNTRLTEGANYFGGWLGDFGTVGSGPVATTYAKPTDTINWVNCYYPGVQRLADKRIVIGNQDGPPYHPSGSNVTLNTRLFKYEIPWTNQYSVESSVTQDPRVGYNNGVFRDAQNAQIIGRPNEVRPDSNAWISTSVDGSNPFRLDVGIAVGNDLIRESGNTYRTLRIDDAGKTFTEVMQTDGTPYFASLTYDDHWWTCCHVNGGGCSACRHHPNTFDMAGMNWVTYSHLSDQLTSTTRVIIPYNFINTASFSIGTPMSGPDVVYAGDEIEIRSANVAVNNRVNDVTEATYTTQVDNAEARLIAYVSDKPADQQIADIQSSRPGGTGVSGEQTPTDMGASSTNICKDTNWLDKKQCMEVNKYNGGTTKLNPDGALGGYTHSGDELGFDRKYNVFDASAGDYMCFVIAVYPWRSGIPQGTSGYNRMHDDTNTDPTGTEHKWLITAPQCKQIAKKPSMEVLGSSVYTNGAIETSVSRKHNLFGSTVYWSTSGTVPGGLAGATVATYFGSFDEQAVVANGLVNRFASGAAVGRTTTNDAGYGASNNDFCNRWVPLTFANYSNNSGFANMICPDVAMAGQAGISDASIVDREALVDYFIPSAGIAQVHAAGSYSLGGAVGKDIPNGAGKDIRYINADGAVTITRSTLGEYQTRIVRAAGDVTITDDIMYSGIYDKAAKVPKAVIYADGDIHIACGVRQIDAILIARNTVYSCDNYTVADTGTMEDRNRSLSQLVINGAILASKVELGRTYGNAAGKYSGVAAEIVNYDTSVLVWGRSAAGSADSNAMSTVYMHELAPRY